MRVERLHMVEDGEEGDYDTIFADGFALGSAEQVTWEDILHALGFSREVTEKDDVVVTTYRSGL